MINTIVNNYLKLCDLSSQEFWLLLGCELCGMPAQPDLIIEHLIKFMKFTANNVNSPISKLPFSLDSQHDISGAIESAIEKKIIYRFDKLTLDKIDMLYKSPILYQTMDQKCLNEKNLDISQLGSKIIKYSFHLLNISITENFYSSQEPFFVIDYYHMTKDIDLFNIVSTTYDGVIEGIKTNGGKLISDISQLGPWVDRWWQIYPFGYIGSAVCPCPETLGSVPNPETGIKN